MSDFPHVFHAKDADIRDISPVNKWKGIRSNLYSAMLAGFAVMFLLFGHHPISGESMYPTYHDGQHLVSIRPYLGELKQGDVVIAYSPNRYLLIKRVAACPGDTLVINTDGTVAVNGEPYTYGKGSSLDSNMVGMTRQEDGSYSITLEKGQYYLLGDNHEISADSREYGPFKRTSIWEKVLFVFGK